MRNAIERVIERKAPFLKRGDNLASNAKRIIKAHPLDTLTDPAVPSWALKILSNSSIGALTRIEMVMTHHFDITGVVPDERLTCPEVIPAHKPTKFELERFREGQAKLARRYLRNKRKIKNEIV